MSETYFTLGFVSLCIYIFIAWYRRMPNAIPLAKFHIYLRQLLFLSWLLAVYMMDLHPSVFGWCRSCLCIAIETITLIGLYRSPYLREIYPPEQRSLYVGDKFMIFSVFIIYTVAFLFAHL